MRMSGFALAFSSSIANGGRWKSTKFSWLLSLESKNPAFIPLLLNCAETGVDTVANANANNNVFILFIVIGVFSVLKMMGLIVLNIVFLDKCRKGAEAENEANKCLKMYEIEDGKYE